MDIKLSQYLKAFLRYWWLVVAMMLLSIGVGLAYSNSQTPLYEAKVVYVASPNLAITDTGDLINGLSTVVRNTELITTACEILESQIIREMAAQRLGIPITMSTDYRVGCVVLPDSTILQVTVQGESPELAADLANALGTTGAVYINDLYEIVKLSLLDSAEVDSEAIFPNHLTNITLSAIVGLAGAVGFIVLRETLLQFWGASDTAALAADADTKPSELNLAVITLKPSITLMENNLSQRQKTDIQKQLAEQVMIFLQQHSRPSDALLYLGNKKFALLMLQTNGQEAVILLDELIDQLRAKTFTVTDTDLSVTYTGSVGIVENKSNMLMWQSLLNKCQQAAQAAAAQGEWCVHVDAAPLEMSNL